MNQKRSLSQSLPTAELPPEAWAVIREGSPQRIETPPKALELAKSPDPESAPARGTSPSLDRKSVV